MSQIITYLKCEHCGKGELYHIPYSGLKWLLPVKGKNKTIS